MKKTDILLKKILNWKSKISFNVGINRTIKEYEKEIG